MQIKHGCNLLVNTQYDHCWNGLGFFFLFELSKRVTMMISRERVTESYLMRTKKSENNSNSG